MKGLFKFRALVAAGVVTLAGCGTVGATLPPATQSFTGDLTAMTTQGLMQGWDQIHQAIFNMIDVKHQGFIDQDEAGPYIPLNDFDNMDKAHEGKINYQQFTDYATQGGFLAPNDTPIRFMGRTRDYLQGAFDKLDVVPGTGIWGLFPERGDGYLSERQVSRKYVSALGMAFTYPRLNIDIEIKGFKLADFKAADHLGIGKLTVGEFEDLYVSTTCELIAAIPGHAHHAHHDPTPTPPASGSLGNDPGNVAPPGDSSGGASGSSQNSSMSSSSSSYGTKIVITTDDYNAQDDIQIDP